jgi:hypothetical protein
MPLNTHLVFTVPEERDVPVTSTETKAAPEARVLDLSIHVGLDGSYQGIQMIVAYKTVGSESIATVPVSFDGTDATIDTAIEAFVDAMLTKAIADGKLPAGTVGP